jgi:hypothetical protein
MAETYKLGSKNELMIEGTAEFTMRVTKVMCETEIAKLEKQLVIWNARLDYIKENEA